METLGNLGKIKKPPPKLDDVYQVNRFELESKLNVKNSLGPLKPLHKKTRSVSSARVKKADLRGSDSEKLF